MRSKYFLSLLALFGCMIVTALAVDRQQQARQKTEDDAEARQTAQENARVRLKLHCVDLRHAAAPLSPADLDDLRTCQTLQAEDWAKVLKEAPQRQAQAAQAEAERRADEARRLRYLCDQLADTKLANLTPRDIGKLHTCQALY